MLVDWLLLRMLRVIDGFVLSVDSAALWDDRLFAQHRPAAQQSSDEVH